MIHVVFLALLGAAANKNNTGKKRPRIMRLCQACKETHVGVEVVRGRVEHASEHIMTRHPQEYDTPLFRKSKCSSNVGNGGCEAMCW